MLSFSLISQNAHSADYDQKIGGNPDRQTIIDKINNRESLENIDISGICLNPKGRENSKGDHYLKGNEKLSFQYIYHKQLNKNNLEGALIDEATYKEWIAKKSNKFFKNADRKFITKNYDFILQENGLYKILKKGNMNNLIAEEISKPATTLIVNKNFNTMNVTSKQNITISAPANKLVNLNEAAKNVANSLQTLLQF